MIIDLLKSKLKSNSIVTFLIALNVSIWLLITVLRILLVLVNVDFQNLLTYLEVPSSLPLLALTPWTPLTYCFLHTEFFHILFNMLALHWFGHMAEEHFSSRHILAIYLFGGIAGALVYVAAFNTLPYFTTHFSHTYLLGASASVLAIATAAAFALPQRRIRLLFIGDFSLKWFTLFMIVVSFLGVTGSNAGGDIAHLGGAALGLLYAALERLFSRRRNIFTRGTRKQTTSQQADFHFQRGTRSSGDTSSDSTFDSEIDPILDKIKRTGYASLSDEEKQRLFRR